MRNPLIVLTSDFGLSDNFVGVMKGVILKIAPYVSVVDLTHEINPQNIKEAAFVLHTAVDFFPEGTIFLTIIDPGVGTDRDAIAFKAANNFFIAPDNGVLTYILRKYKIEGVYSLTNVKYHLEKVSPTFHGRDIFAPAAAHIANGVPLQELGKRISPYNLVTLSNPQCFLDSQNIWHGEVIHIDHFGNIVTSLHESSLKIAPSKNIDKNSYWVVETGDMKIQSLSYTFGDVGVGSFVAYLGSSGYIEIGMRDGNAAAVKNIKTGDNVYAYKVEKK